MRGIVFLDAEVVKVPRKKWWVMIWYRREIIKVLMQQVRNTIYKIGE